MDSIEKGLRVRKFFEIEAVTMLERYKVIETLLPHSINKGAAHPGEEGRFIEALLRSFLNKHLPNNIRALSGFILCPSTKTGVQNLDRVLMHEDRHSSQIDIIVYDIDNYPIFERFEEFVIVPPEGVVGIISVKKKLYNKDIKSEIVSIKAAADLCREAPQPNGERRRGPFTALFAFTAEEKCDAMVGRKIFNAIEASHADSAFDTMLNEVSILGRTCVFKNRREHGRANNARYIAVDCSNEPHIPLQRLLQSLLSVYYDQTRVTGRSRPGFASFRKSTFADSPELGFVRYNEP